MNSWLCWWGLISKVKYVPINMVFDKTEVLSFLHSLHVDDFGKVLDMMKVGMIKASKLEIDMMVTSFVVSIFHFS